MVPDLVTAVAVDTVKLGLRESGVTSISAALRGRGKDRYDPGRLKATTKLETLLTWHYVTTAELPQHCFQLFINHLREVNQIRYRDSWRMCKFGNDWDKIPQIKNLFDT